MTKPLTEDERRIIRGLLEGANAGNPIAERFYSRIEEAGTAEEKRDVLVSMKASFEGMFVFIEGAYVGLSEVVGKYTGLTLEDFLWLRGYESSRGEGEEA